MSELLPLPEDMSEATAEGNLREVSDDDWLAAHTRLIDADVLPVAETAYVWEPGRTVEELGLTRPPAPGVRVSPDPDADVEDALATLPRGATSTNAEQMAAVIARCRRAGIEVREMPGWAGRGRSWAFRPGAVVDHHDASTRKSGEWGLLGYIMDGSDIAPLAQWQVARCLDEVPKVAAIAAGGANHAGAGGPWLNIPRDAANYYSYGVEKANDGVGEPYSEAALYAAAGLLRAILEVVT